ncbi:MAG: hypothetical protein KDD11_00465 [Acidobacteria bacterium]|nr:hypothetical protein [Acidobacteriota bacterium]
MSESQKGLAVRLIAALDDEIRSRPRGAIFAMEQDLGKSCGWWLGRVNSGRLSTQNLFEVLDHLGLDRIAFLRRHVGRADGLELNQPPGPVPPLVHRALERAHQGRETRGLGANFVDALDEQRYDDPQGVVRTAQWAVDLIELALLPRLLGIIGSAHRLLLEVDEAEHYLHAAVEACQLHGDDVCLGNLLRRYSYVLGDRTDYAGALRLAEQGTLLLLRHGDGIGLGKGLVEQGLWLHYLGRDQLAVKSLQAALLHLPRDLERYRFSAFQTMGLAFQAAGDSDHALECLVRAEEEGTRLGTWASHKIQWVKGRILETCGRLEEAAMIFQRLVVRLREQHVGEAILVTCELVRVRLRQGKAEEAIMGVRSMLPFLEVLGKHPVISEAIAELARSIEVGLSLALLERVISRLEGERRLRSSWAKLRLAS